MEAACSQLAHNTVTPTRLPVTPRSILQGARLAAGALVPSVSVHKSNLCRHWWPPLSLMLPSDLPRACPRQGWADAAVAGCWLSSWGWIPHAVVQLGLSCSKLRLLFLPSLKSIARRQRRLRWARGAFSSWAGAGRERKRCAAPCRLPLWGEKGRECGKSSGPGRPQRRLRASWIPFQQTESLGCLCWTQPHAN